MSQPHDQRDCQCIKKNDCRHARPRLETLSYLIYGLSLSIGAISLVITNSTRSNAIDIDRNILEFLFVFLILITSSIVYTATCRSY